MKDIDADYYGYRDDDDGLLLPAEMTEEKKGLEFVFLCQHSMLMHAVEHKVDISRLKTSKLNTFCTKKRSVRSKKICENHSFHKI